MDSRDFGLKERGFWAFASWYGLRGVYGGLQNRAQVGEGPKGGSQPGRLEQPIMPEILGASRGSLGLYF